MSKHKLTDEQLGFKNNRMIKDSDPLASDAGKPGVPSKLIDQIGRLNEIMRTAKLGDDRAEAEAILAQMLRDAQ